MNPILKRDAEQWLADAPSTTVPDHVKDYVTYLQEQVSGLSTAVTTGRELYDEALRRFDAIHQALDVLPLEHREKVWETMQELLK